MADGLLIALVGFVAAIVGGLIQAWATRRFEISRFERQNRHEAYLSYLNGISQLSHAIDEDGAHRAANAIVAEARGRIALCGSDRVIEQMTKVFEHGDDLYSAAARADITALIAAMRSDSVGPTNPRIGRELFVMLYGDAPRRNIK